MAAATGPAGERILGFGLDRHPCVSRDDAVIGTSPAPAQKPSEDGGGGGGDGQLADRCGVERKVALQRVFAAAQRDLLHHGPIVRCEVGRTDRPRGEVGLGDGKHCPTPDAAQATDGQRWDGSAGEVAVDRGPFVVIGVWVARAKRQVPRKGADGRSVTGQQRRVGL